MNEAERAKPTLGAGVMADTEDTETLAELLWSVDGEYSDVACEMVLTSDWLLARDERIRADEREKLGAEIHVAMEEATVGRLNEPGDWKRGARRIRVAVRRVIDPDALAGEVEAR